MILARRSTQKSFPRRAFALSGYALAGALLLAATAARADSAQPSPALRDVFDSPGKWILGAQETCWPHAWSSGDGARFAVNVASELCLRGRFGKDVPVSDMRTSILAQSAGNGTILDANLNLYAARAEAIMPLSGTPTAEAEVLALGYQVWVESITAPELEFERSFTLLNFDQAISAPFRIGPVPATVAAGVRARLDANVRGVLAIANARGELVPELRSGGYAQVAVDALVAKAGVEGELEFLNDTLRLDGVVGLGVDATKFPPTVYYAGAAKGTNSLSALSGGITLYAQMLGNGNRFQNRFFEWEGYRNDGELFSATLDPVPLFQQDARMLDGAVEAVAFR